MSNTSRSTRSGLDSEPELADLASTAARVHELDQLGELLQRLRRRQARRHGTAPLTVRELARRTGYAYGVISDYLNGKALAPTDRFDVLVRLLDADPAEQQALATARDRVEDRRRARRAGRVPRELPPRVPGFTGRGGELAELDLLLDPARAGGGASIAVVSGTAGVGKTALAVHWAHRVGAALPDGCLYRDLCGYDPDQPVAPAEVLAGFLRSLGLPGAEVPPTETERAARYRSLLAYRRMLVLLDNARDADQVRLLLPGGAGCVTVVTSRDALPGLVARYGARQIELPPLSRAEAVELLGGLLGGRVAGEPAAADTLADRCARLPLPLRLVARLASARPGANLAMLAGELADVRERLDRLDAGGDSRTACRAAFSWSYQHLTAATARAFRLFGLYPGHDLDEYGLAALAGTDLDQARSLLQDLARAHLVQLTRPDRYGMHDLLRGYAAELAARDSASERRAALARLRDQQLFACAAALELVAPFDRDRRPKVPDPGWPVPSLTDPDAAFDWLDTERANLVATAVHAADDQPDQQADRHLSQLAGTLLRYLDTGAHYHDAELLYRRAAATTTGVDRAHVLTSLGVVCWRLGRYREAARYHEQALALAQAAGNDTELGRALLSLVIVYWHLGRTAETLDYGDRALRLYRRTGDRLGQARMLGNLGTIQGQLGDLPAAVAHHQRALELFRTAGDPAGSANERCGLGSVLTTLGRVAEALDYLLDALGSARRAGYRECEAEALGHLGSAYLRLGRTAEALDHCQRALALVRAISDRTTEAWALGQLGSVHEQLGDHARAVDHHRRALRIAREIGDGQLAAELLNRLGDALRSGSRPVAAHRAHQRALARSRRNGNRYQQARAHHGLARALTDLGDADAAAGHWEQARTRYTQLGVPEAVEIQSEHPPPGPVNAG